MGLESSKTSVSPSGREDVEAEQHYDARGNVFITQPTCRSPTSEHRSHNLLNDTSNSFTTSSISRDFGAVGNRDSALPPCLGSNEYVRGHAAPKHRQTGSDAPATSSQMQMGASEEGFGAPYLHDESEDEAEHRRQFISREFGAMGNRDSALPPCLDWNKYARERDARKRSRQTGSDAPATSSQMQMGASQAGSVSTLKLRSGEPVTYATLLARNRMGTPGFKPGLGASVASSQTKPEVSVACSQPRSEVPAAHSQPRSEIIAARNQLRSEVPVACSQPRSEVAAAHSQLRSEVPVPAACQPRSEVPAACSQPRSEVAAACSQPRSEVAAACSQPRSEVAAAPSQAEAELSSASALLRSVLDHLNGNHDKTSKYFELLIELVNLVSKCPPPTQSLPQEISEKYHNSLKFLASFKSVKDKASQTDGMSHLNQTSDAVTTYEHGAQTSPMSSDVSHDSREHLSNGTARLSNASSSESLTISEKSFDDNSPALVCEDCKDEITMYNGDLSLSWDKHCQNFRHQLAIRPAEKEHPLVIEPKQSAHSTKVFQTDKGSSLDWFKDEVDKMGENSNVSVSPNKFTCKLCGVVSTNPINLMQHLKGKNHIAAKMTAKTKLAATKLLKEARSSIEKKPQFNCQVCQKALLSEIGLLQHLDSHHNDLSNKSTKNVSEKSTEFLCKICQKSFKKELALLQHSKDSHGCEKNILNDGKSIDLKEALRAKMPTISCPKATQEIPVQPALSKASTSTQSKCLEVEPNEANKEIQPNSTWISVKGGHSLPIEKMLEVFSKFGTIKFIYVVPKSKEWRIQYQSRLNVDHIVKSKPEIKVKNINLLVNALPQNEAPKPTQRIGPEHHQLLSLELTQIGQSMLLNEVALSSTLQRLEEKAKCANQQSKQVQEVCVMIESLLRAHYPQCRAYQFGSRATGLASIGSDVDIYFDIGNSYKGIFNQSEREQKIICDIVANVLKKSKACNKIEKVPSARVPIVKFIHKSTLLACDVSFRSGLGHRNTTLIRLLSNLESRLRPLLLITKEWLRCCCIEAGKRGITSYALSMMVVCYLQCLRPPVLPSINYLQQRVPQSEHVFVNGWDCTIPLDKIPFQSMNTDKVPELLRGFFIFYSGFDFANYIVCPLLGEPVHRNLFGQDQQPPPYTEPTLSVYLESLRRKNDVPRFATEKPMCVQDPFDLSHNVAKGVPHFLLLKFQYMCRESQKVMAKWKLPNKTLHAPPGWPGL